MIFTAPVPKGVTLLTDFFSPYQHLGSRNNSKKGFTQMSADQVPGDSRRTCSRRLAQVGARKWMQKVFLADTRR
mgnify:CR=1 FL=1